MARPDLGSQVQQQPLNSFGVLGQHAGMGLARIYCGTGGMPVPDRNYATGVATGLRTVIGFNGLGATLVGTGLYEISHPPANILTVIPQWVGQSGMAGALTPQLSAGNSASGVFRIQATSPNLGTGTTPPSGFIGKPYNPPSGTRFDLLMFFNPRNDQGFTQY